MENKDIEYKEIVKAVVKEIRKEEKEKKKKEIYHNTQVLMKNYNDLKSHMKNAIDDINGLDSTDIDLTNLNKDEIYILSIKKSKVKTVIMISHIDIALKALKKKQMNNNAIEKYRALELYYLKEKTYEELAENLKCSVISGRRWVSEMLRELSVFLFGIEALKI